MSYLRVIPRDLFNDANLLKCYGQLWLLTEGKKQVSWTHMDKDWNGDPGYFDIVQDDSDGSTNVDNVSFLIHGIRLHLYRPLNSREEYPLELAWFGRDIEVFDGAELSTEFLCILNLSANDIAKEY